MFQDEISKLVAQTFSQTKDFTGHFHEDFQFESDTKRHLRPINKPEEIPGFFYNLEVKPSTFVIRILESENLAMDYEKILERPEDYPSLRLVGDEELSPFDKLQFFECDTVSITRAVKRQLSNKRFPKFEEHVFNVSDPGDSWWINCQGHTFTLYFKLSHTEQIERLIKIGPLGDIDIATNNLHHFYGLLSTLFPVEDFSSAHGQFSISTTNKDHPFFQDFVNIFKTGDAGHEFWMQLWSLERDCRNDEERASVQAAIYYLMELSVIRRFWGTITQQIN
jgi:hypothetical protein